MWVGGQHIKLSGELESIGARNLLLNDTINRRGLKLSHIPDSQASPAHTPGQVCLLENVHNGKEMELRKGCLIML
jgi:hypothetical protein